MVGYNEISIQLEDGRTIVARPRPEDQEFLDGYRDRDIELSAGEGDTTGHVIAATDDLTVDVEGHAMTLRLPTPADAEALRRALAVGIVSATVVAAGAIAALQGSPGTTSTTQTVVRPNPPAAPMQDFQSRKEAQTDRMLEAPAGEAPAVDAPSNHRVGGPQD
jgi:hypothetical protein